MVAVFHVFSSLCSFSIYVPFVLGWHMELVFGNDQLRHELYRCIVWIVFQALLFLRSYLTYLFLFLILTFIPDMVRAKVGP